MWLHMIQNSFLKSERIQRQTSPWSSQEINGVIHVMRLHESIISASSQTDSVGGQRSTWWWTILHYIFPWNEGDHWLKLPSGRRRNLGVRRWHCFSWFSFFKIWLKFQDENQNTNKSIAFITVCKSIFEDTGLLMMDLLNKMWGERDYRNSRKDWAHFSFNRREQWRPR